jgi:hypothetical protein
MHFYPSFPYLTFLKLGSFPDQISLNTFIEMRDVILCINLKPYSNYAFETAVFNIFERGDKKQLL